MVLKANLSFDIREQSQVIQHRMNTERTQRDQKKGMGSQTTIERLLSSILYAILYASHQLVFPFLSSCGEREYTVVQEGWLREHLFPPHKPSLFPSYLDPSSLLEITVKLLKKGHSLNLFFSLKESVLFKKSPSSLRHTHNVACKQVIKDRLEIAFGDDKKRVKWNESLRQRRCSSRQVMAPSWWSFV